MDVLDCAVMGELAAPRAGSALDAIAGGNDGDLGRKVNVCFKNCRAQRASVAQLSPSTLQIRQAAHKPLALAVISIRCGLQHGGEAYSAACGGEIGRRLYRSELWHRQAGVG